LSSLFILAKMFKTKAFSVSVEGGDTPFASLIFEMEEHPITEFKLYWQYKQFDTNVYLLFS